MTNTPAHRQQWILEELKKSPLLSFEGCWTKYKLNYTNSRSTFVNDWKKAQSEFKTYQNKLQTEKERVSIETEIEAVKQGLKTKIDRLLNYQKLVDDCLKDLAEGMTNDISFKEGKPTQYRRKMTITEYNQTRKTLKELQSEISKIEGDYAPIKQDHTTQGEKLGDNIITFVTIDENGNKITETPN